MAQRVVFLDGLRGWASLAVVNYHIFCSGLAVNDFWRDEVSRRLPFNGNLAVALFFVLSGFALSVRFVEDGDRWALGRLAVGRYLRLAIPIAAACLIVLVAQFGLLLPSSGRPEQFQSMLPGGPDLGHFLRFVTFDVFFAYDAAQTYIGPLWTMSYELVGSVIVFAALFLFVAWRPVMLLGLIIGLVWHGDFYLALFPAGMLLADLYRPIDAPGIAMPLLFIGIALPVFGSGSVPELMVSALALFGAVLLLPPLQELLSTPLSRWMGKISFPLYLLHGPVMWIVGLHLIPADQFDSPLSILVRVGLVLLSIAAAAAFVPVENFAKTVAHRVGQLVLPKRLAVAD